MRVLILIALLCNVAFSALYLNGAEYTQMVTINHVQVAETSSDFLYQLKIPRVGALLTAVESADDVAFTNVNDTTRRARWVVYTPDTIFLYAHIAVSSTVDTSYRLQYGKALNEVNSSATFTNCGIVSMVGSDTIDGTSILDYANGNILTTEGSYTKSIFSNGSVTTHAQDIAGFPLLGGMTALTTTCVITPDDAATANICLAYRVSAPAFQWSFTNAGLYVAFSNSIYGLYNTQLSSGSTYHIAIVYNGVGATNADKVKLYINGESKALTFTGPIPSSITTISGADTRFGLRDVTVASFSGIMDNYIICSTPQTIGCITDQYNMLFNPSTFSTLGTPLATEFSAEMGIDTLRLVCSAENALTYQWYDNNVAVSGATDSVYTIYADSVFYSIKHVIYCLVNGTVKSGEWKFQATVSRISRWDSYKRFYKQGYKNTWK